MRILLVSLNYKPELTGIGKYSGEMAEWLAKQGHDVSVVTAPPYYPQWVVPENYHSFLYKHETMADVDVWRCPLWVPVKPSGLKRILHLASFAVMSFPVVFRQMFRRPDIVLVVEPPLFCAPSVVFLSRIFRAKSWLHIQDFEVDAAFELGILSSNRLKSFVQKIESWLMSKFDRVSTISNQMIHKLDIKKVSTKKQVLFPNWVDINQIYPLNSINQFRLELNIPASNIVCLYSGNMGEKQGLEIVIEAARCLKEHNNITFVMCGHGAAYERLFNMANGLHNVLWLPLQPLDKLNALLNMADIHLLPQKAGAADLVMPSKLTGMLASGRPVLATAMSNTQIAEVLQDSGVIVPPEAIDLFVDAIEMLAEDAAERYRLGNNAREYAEKQLGLEAIMLRFESSLLECISQ